VCVCVCALCVSVCVCVCIYINEQCVDPVLSLSVVLEQQRFASGTVVNSCVEGEGPATGLLLSILRGKRMGGEYCGA
jgi:hypothetical protein